jgi:hypothetical protein
VGVLARRERPSHVRGIRRHHAGRIRQQTGNCAGEGIAALPRRAVTCSMWWR